MGCFGITVALGPTSRKMPRTEVLLKAIECDFCATEPSEVTVTRKDRHGAVRSCLRLCRRCVDLQQYVTLVKARTQKPPCFVCQQPASVETIHRKTGGPLLGRVMMCRKCTAEPSPHVFGMLSTANLWTPGVIELPQAPERT